MSDLSYLKYLQGIYDVNLSQTSEVHSAIIKSIYDEFIACEGDLDQMRLEMCIKTASGYWLDLWGDYFGVYRRTDETDDVYSKRIIDYVITPKSTIPAIKTHIVDFLNEKYKKNYTTEDVVIKEPWKGLAKYSHKGQLSNDSLFYSKDYYCHAVIDISIPENVTTDLIDLVKDVKAGGVKVIWSIFTNWDIVNVSNTNRDGYASYTRHIQTKVYSYFHTGLVLSNTSPSPYLSGIRQTWNGLETNYYWYAHFKDRDADKSTILTKYDLFGLLDEYIEVYKEVDTDISDNTVVLENSEQYVLFSGLPQYIHRDYLADALKQSIKDNKLSDVHMISGDVADVWVVERNHKLTDDVLKQLNSLSKYLELNRGKLNEDYLLSRIDSHELYYQLCYTLSRFKQSDEYYYNSVQSPILTLSNKTRTNWYVANDAWIWGSPALTLKDYSNALITDEKPTDENSLKAFYKKEQKNVGDRYQPLINIGKKQYATTIGPKDWLFSSATFCIEDLNELYRYQFRYIPDMMLVDNPECTLEDIMNLEESYVGYSTVPDNAQSIISVLSE